MAVNAADDGAANGRYYSCASVCALVGDPHLRSLIHLPVSGSVQACPSKLRARYAHVYCLPAYDVLKLPGVHAHAHALMARRIALPGGRNNVAHPVFGVTVRKDPSRHYGRSSKQSPRGTRSTSLERDTQAETYAIHVSPLLSTDGALTCICRYNTYPEAEYRGGDV